MGLLGFGKSPGGSDAVDIAGHEIPVSLLGVAAAAAGVFVVVRARNKGSNVVAVGPQAAGGGVALPSGYSPSDATQSGLADQLNVLSNELGQLLAGQQSGGFGAGVGTPPPTPPPPVPPTPPPTQPPTPTPLDPTGQIVDNIYQAELGRHVDAPSINFWEHSVAQIGPAAVAQEIAGSPEGQQFQANALYQHYLGRPVESGNVQNVISAIQASGWQAVATNLAASPEAQQYAANHHPIV